MWQVGVNLGPYLHKAGIHPFLSLLILVVLNVSIVSYIGVPLMVSQFGHWLAMDRPRYRKNVIGFLDAGLPYNIKMLVVLTYLAINILCGALV